MGFEQVVQVPQPVSERSRVLDRIHDFRRRAIARAIADWSDTDRAALARLLPRFVRDFEALTAVDH